MPRPCDLDLLTLKVVPESRVTWATFLRILVFLGLFVLDLGPVYATDVRQTDVRQHHHLMPPARGRGYIINVFVYFDYIILHNDLVMTQLTLCRMLLSTGIRWRHTWSRENDTQRPTGLRQTTSSTPTQSVNVSRRTRRYRSRDIFAMRRAIEPNGISMTTTLD